MLKGGAIVFQETGGMSVVEESMEESEVRREGKGVQESGTKKV